MAAAEGQLWVIVVAGIFLVEVIGLMLLQKSKNDDLAKMLKRNQEVQANIDDIKRQISDRDQIKTQLKELLDREDAIQKLQSARTGPTSVMLELSHLLTPGRMPTVDRDKLEELKRQAPLQVPNVNWDAHRLWLTSYDEVDRNVRLIGYAKDGEDLSEFLRRLQLSDFFYDVRMLPAGKSNDGPNHAEVVHFEVVAKVRY
jgi:type IV pilus assembly protein PilN